VISAAGNHFARLMRSLPPEFSSYLQQTFLAKNHQLAITNRQSGTSFCTILIITSTIYKDDAEGCSRLSIGDG
jgi:hypothetical protein